MMWNKMADAAMLWTPLDIIWSIFRDKKIAPKLQIFFVDFVKSIRWLLNFARFKFLTSNILEKNHKKHMKNMKQWNTNIQDINIKQCNYVK